MQGLQHLYPFDPTYGYTVDEMLRILPPEAPGDFEDFWQKRHRAALAISPEPELSPTPTPIGEFLAHELYFRSTNGFRIGGWLLRPKNGRIERALIVGHGYDGRHQPDPKPHIENAVVLFPCFRGMGRSARDPISQDPFWHVLHDIQDRDKYILGGCAEDLWMAVSALLALHPEVEGRIGYSGISFGGGIGSLALPWEERISRAHFCVPTFGHHPLRLTLPSYGSLLSVRQHFHYHPEVVDTLCYFDAAIAARFVSQTVHVAAAAFDPMVPPPGQFAIFNALPAQKQLHVLDAGHFDYPGKLEQERYLHAELTRFFSQL